MTWKRKGYILKQEDKKDHFTIVKEIERLKKEKNAIVLAHYYQTGDIQDIADYIGDSLGLSRKAADTKADIIVFAGVHFMAETAKALSPTKKVLIPDLDAGCSLAEGCQYGDFLKFKNKYPDHKVVMYVNSSAEVKTISDVICTSSNAVAIVNSFPKDQKLIFAPDKNLGHYVMKKTNRDLVIWDGACIVHEIFSREKILKLKLEYPEAEIIAHPECEQHILDLSDFIGSTTALLKYTINSENKTFIVATETGIIHQMEKNSPEKLFIPAPPNNSCECNDCPYMKLNTMDKLYNCLKNETPEINTDLKILEASKKPIEKMLELSKELNL